MRQRALHRNPTFITGCVLSSVLMLSETCARALLSPTGLIGVPMVVLVLILVTLAWGFPTALLALLGTA